jgi:ankyrin repeat protein
MKISKTKILSCILGIALVNGVCVATQQPITKDAETQTNVNDAATLADMQEKWFKAVESNDLTEVTRMIEASEINPNVKDNSKLKETALHKAAKDPKKSEIAKILINHPSVNVNATDATGATPLFGATEVKNNIIVTNLLLAHKEIDVRVRNNSTPYPLTPYRNIIAYFTFDEKRDIYFPYLRKKRIKLTDDEYRDMKDFAKKAIRARQIKDSEEWVDLIVEHMLAERAAPCSKKDQLEWRDAVQSNDLLKMEKLIKKGIDINLICFSHGTALHNAVFNKNTETINFLLKNKADINIYGSLSYTPLRIATTQGDKEILEILLKYPGADINDPQDALLYTAVQNKVKNIVEFLLSQKGININFVASNGWTPLREAIYRNNSEIVELLLSQEEIEVNSADSSASSNRWTPLHEAACQNNSKIIKLLLQQNKINVNAVSSTKKTPLHIAVGNSKKEATELLLEKETIDVTLLDEQQLTPLDEAIQRPNTDIILLLLRKIKEKELKIPNETYEKIKQKPNLCGNNEILGLANELKQNTVPTD